ncbi:MAG: glycosyltransferase family 4 protein [Bacteroidota bacterium]
MKRSARPVVALVSDAIYPYNRGGKEVRYHEFSRRIADRAEVHVYTMRWWEGARTRDEQDITFHAISPMLPLYARNRRSIGQAAVFAIACLRLLWQRFDVLEADHMPYLQIPVLRLVTLVRRKRFVVTWHEVWGPGYWRQYLGLPGIAAWAVEWLAMRLPDHIVAASPQTAERLCTLLGRSDRITVAPNGIDLEAVNAALPASVPADLVVVSRLLPHKRIDMLLDAVALLHEQGMKVTCRVIGDGPEREALHAQASELGIASAIDFRHDVDEQKELYALVKAARVFAFPSAREGFGIAVLEALACGIRVVTTSAPDNLARHLVSGASQGVICDPTAEAMAAAAARLLSENPAADPDPQPAAWLSGYSWDAMVQRVSQALLI